VLLIIDEHELRDDLIDINVVLRKLNSRSKYSLIFMVSLSRRQDVISHDSEYTVSPLKCPRDPY
jgi:hypothetical protein